MIHLFRKLRHKMLQKNFILKYLLYALGEIILVVIGILLALQINTWNAEKQDRRQEKDYLTSLKTDLEGSIKELQRVLIENKQTSQYTYDILTIIASSESQENEKLLDSMVLKTLSYTDAVLLTATIEDIKQSSNLNVITNDSLRRFIATWNNDFQAVEEAETNLKNAFDKHLEALSSISNFSLYVTKGSSPFNNDLLAVIKTNNKLENSFAHMNVWSKSIADLYQNRKYQLEIMLELVKQELQNNV